MSTAPNWSIESEKCLIAQNTEVKNLLRNPLLKKDSWQIVEDLGLEICEHRRIFTFNFSSIRQDWFKLLVKLYVLLRSQRKLSAQYIKQDISHLRKFSDFLEEKYIFNPEEINNQLFEEFDYYLKLENKSERTISLYYMTLINFFNLCRQEKLLNIDTYWFKGKYKVSKPKDIDYIPEEVWQQLEENLHHLPDPIQRIVIILRATGMRIGELLLLPKNCLRQRNKQWRLRLFTEKYKVEDEIPICEELVTIIKEQQEYATEHYGDDYIYLFGSNKRGSKIGSYIPIARVMKSETFNAFLKKLAIEYNICTKHGQIWNFKSHQFRKTIATIMANAGVRDLIIQKYLRHRSPDMQNYYKNLLKKVLGDEYQELMKETKYINSTGHIVATHKPNNPITELMRRKMYQVTTQYGECHRPVLKSPCQTVNACWRCEHWLTSTNDLDALKNDIQRVEAELEIAKNLGMVRQQTELVKDQQSLVIRIQRLEQQS